MKRDDTKKNFTALSGNFYIKFIYFSFYKVLIIICIYIFLQMLNILRAGIIFFDDRRKINILKDMFEKEMKLQFLSMLFLRIICLIFAFCLVQNRANAQETLRANGMGIIANARVNEVEVPSLNGGDAISIANNSMLPMQGNLSDFHFPAIQKRKIAGRASAAVNVSGIVDASTLADDAELVLTGNTNLFMDVNKTLKCISGDYSLTLSGGNLLTLNNSTGYAIDVSSLTISAPLHVKSSCVAVAAKTGMTINSTVNATSTDTGIGTVSGTLTINADVTVTTNSSAAIINRGLDNGGDIIINKGVIKATGGNSGTWAYGIAARGSITIESGEIIAKGGTAGLFTEIGSITIASPLIIASPWGGKVRSDGHCVVNENNEVQSRVVIMTQPISGTVTLSSIPVPVESLVGDTFIAKISWLNAQNADFEYNLHFTIDSVKKNLEMDMITYTNDGSVIFNKDFNSNQSLIFSSNSEGYFLMKLPVVASLSSKFSLSLRSKNRTEILITQKINN